MQTKFSPDKALTAIAQSARTDTVEDMRREYATAVQAIGSDMSTFTAFEEAVAPHLCRGYRRGMDEELRTARQLLANGNFNEGSRAVAAAKIYARAANVPWERFALEVNAMYASYQQRFVFGK